ncbi:2OG-Fe(II) oxygenase [Sorangium sp. So ce145]|uniref:2OG-Fe(II) oxygenase n=1 Tax=Sorangium sp. So ce145 TaxID=3133285 RepID=UPI003F5E7645
MIDTEKARQDLLDPSLGFFVIRGLFSTKETDKYRESCERFMTDARRIRARIITNSMCDYVHPRSHDHVERTARIYQYLHNHQDDFIGGLLGRAIAIRDTIESAWLSNPIYRNEKATLHDYVIVTHYYGNRGMLSRHRDYNGPAPLPLIQFWVALSEPGKDYEGGNLVIYSKDGTRRRVEADLGLRRGDALIFDKTLLHEVELTQIPADGAARGRWTVLIGARAPRDTIFSASKKKILYGPPLYPLVAFGTTMLKRMRSNAAPS